MSRPVAFVAVAYVAFITIVFCLPSVTPVDSQTLNYTRKWTHETLATKDFPLILTDNSKCLLFYSCRDRHSIALGLRIVVPFR
jgi:hypothetical protein